MKLLLDTHALLWWVEDHPKLSKKARESISSNDCFVSIASAWEMAIKISLGKLALSVSVPKYFEEHVVENRFGVLPIDLKSLGMVEKLPHHHGDPFDRLLVAQAKANGFSVVSVDTCFSSYGVKRVW